MEKTFAHGALLSATVLTAYMIFSPPVLLSAQNEVTIDETVKVRKAVIQDVDYKDNVVVVELETAKGVAIPVITTGSTTITLGNGNETQLPTLRPGMAIYVFGVYTKETGTIEGEKIVIRNRPVTERTTMSRAEIEKSKRAALFRGQGSEEDDRFEALGLLRAD